MRKVGSTECPLWVKSCRTIRRGPCPLYSRKLPRQLPTGASAMGQKQTCPFRVRNLASGPEQLDALKRFGRPRSKTVQGELGPLVRVYVYKDVVVLFLGRLVLPIEIRWIVGGHFDARPAGEYWILFSAAAAQEQILHAIHLE